MAARTMGRRAAVALAVLGLAALLGPPFFNANRFKGRLVSAMEAALGRPVAVDEVTLRLLPRPGFDLKNLVVSDVPEFGAEPLLRATEVTASLRLTSLWRGRMEIAHLSLAEPSLNLVRSAEGRWNLESLLAHAAQAPVAPTGLVRAETRPRFPYIEADDGRINFKLGQEKKAFALSEAEFALWLESEEAWGVRLEGRPVRTDANLTDTGTFRLRGTLGRAPSLPETALQFDLELEKAQLGQLSHLLLGRDSGWRGALQLAVSVSGLLRELEVRSSAEVRDFRRLDLVGGTGLHSVAQCTGRYRAQGESLEGIACLMPAENGDLALRGTIAGIFEHRRYDLTLAARELSMNSLAQLARRAKSNLPEDISAAGVLNAAFTLRSHEDGNLHWEGGGAVAGFRLRTSLLPTELVPGEVKFTVEDDLSRTGRKKGPKREGSRLVAAARVPLGGPAPIAVQSYLTSSDYRVELHGEADVPSLARAAASLGLPLPLTPTKGRAKVDLAVSGRWAGFAAPMVTGRALLRQTRLQPAGLAAALEIAEGELLLTHAEAQLRNFSASVPAARLNFTGSVARNRRCESPCVLLLRVSLQASDLATDELNRLLNPRLQDKSWFGLGGGKPAEGALSRVRAEGRITAQRVRIKSLEATRFSAQVEWKDGKLTLQDVEADLLGGQQRDGRWTADFTGAQPGYEGAAVLSDISMEQASRVMRTPWATGEVSGRIELQTRGWDAAELAQSATGSGELRWRNGSFLRLRLPSATSPLQWRRLDASLTLRDGQFTLAEGKMDTPSGRFEVSGTATLGRELDLKLLREGAESFAVTGTLSEPKAAFLRGTRAALPLR